MQVHTHKNSDKLQNVAFLEQKGGDMGPRKGEGEGGVLGNRKGGGEGRQGDDKPTRK